MVQDKQEGIIYGSIPILLESDGYAGVVDASEVAYSYKVENETTKINKSVKDKINDIEQSISNAVTQQLVLGIVTDKITELNIPTAESINQATTSALNSAQQAEGYSNTSLTNANNSQTAFNKIHYGYFIDSLKNIVAVPNNSGEFTGIGIYNGQTPRLVGEEYKLKEATSNNEITCYFIKSINTYNDEFEKIIEVADAFATGFDVDALFAIVSEQTYSDPSFTKEDNHIYFIY